jgi:hypothetical protein
VPRHVLLVPGFFGFTGTGDFAYFWHVRDLPARDRKASVDVRVGLGVYPQATHAVYLALHRIARRMSAERAPEITTAHAEVLRKGALSGRSTPRILPFTASGR